MAKAVKSLRLNETAVARLAALAQQRGASESQVVETLILGPQIAADNDQGSAGVAKARLQAESSERQRRAFQPGVADPEKLSAFQERSGMTKWGKKRGSG